LIPQVSVKFEISLSSKLLTNLVLLSLKVREFSSFNSILLSLSNFSNAFHDSI